MTTSKAPVSLRPAPLAPSAVPSTSNQPQLNPTACSTCVRRKVKCDRTHPCSTCRTGQFVCEYPDPTPRKRKRKDFEELQHRLDRYERLLKENGLSVKQRHSSDPPQSLPDPPEKDRFSQPKAFPVADASNGATEKGIMVAGPGPGQTRYVESHLWRDLGDDMHPGSDDDDQAEQEPPPSRVPTAHPSPVDLVSAGLLGASPPSSNLTHLHPTPEDAMQLWQVYLRNVDAIVKIVHGPSTTALIESASGKAGGLSKEAECLLFSIYHFAVTSMAETERLEIIGESWQAVQRRYHDATRQALIGCSFYQTTNLTVLQAYLLLLISVRFRYNPHTFWILCGIAVRLAQRMGLHSEGEQHLNPFDVQMRRRAWWYILMTDNFAAQQGGTTVATIPADSWDAPRPLNIDDSDIWPGMTEHPQEKQAATDMIILLVRIEIVVFRAKLAITWQIQGPEELELSLKQLEDTIEGKYLRYCDVTDPTHYLIMVGTRAALLNARLRTRLTRIKAGTATAKERKEIFALALKLLDHDVALTSSPLTARYAWQWQAFFSWEPLICALKELCQEQEPDQDDRAWEKIERVFAGHPNILTPTRSIEIALGRLTLRAWELTQRRSLVTRLEPACVSSLRRTFERRVDSRKATETAKGTPDESNTLRAQGDSPVAQTVSMDMVIGTDSGLTWDDLEADIDWKFWDDLIRHSEMEGANF